MSRPTMGISERSLTLGFSPQPPLLPKACGHVIGAVSRDRTWQDRSMCSTAWTFIYFEGASKLAHIMNGSLCCTVLATAFTPPKKKPQQTEKLRAHCSEAEVLVSCYRKPNVVELIINSIK